jgi:hypothetical protein
LEGCRVFLLTTTSLLQEPWPREHLEDVFALPSFTDRRGLLNAVSYLSRTRKFDRIVALDDFDVESAAALREHFRMTGMNESQARLFRDKLAMRTRARELGITVPEFTGLFQVDSIKEFLSKVPPPWLLKPRSEASAAGIRKLMHPQEVWREIDRLGDRQSFHLLERFVAGDLYHVDSLVQDGTVIFAEVNGYVRPLLDVYQQGGIYATRTVPLDRPEVAELASANERVLTGFGLQRGASHTEFLRSKDDGKIYFVETSARVGGSNTAEMVEGATGVNLWEEWAALEIRSDYKLPETFRRYGGVVVSLARQDWPDSSPFTDPEIVYRMNMKQHIGLVLASDSPQRIEHLLADYTRRIAKDYLAVLPPADKVSH